MKKLLQSGLIYTIGNLLIRGIGFITLPIYTRIISPEIFGQYNLYLSWVGILSLFVTLPTADSLQMAKIRLFKSEDGYNRYASHALSVSNSIFLVILAICLIFREQFALLTGFSVPIFLIIIVHCYLSFILVFIGNYFIVLQKSLSHLIISIFMTIGSVVLSIALIYKWENDFFARIAGGFIPLMIAAIFSLGYIYYRGRIFISKKYLKFTIVVSSPFIFHHLGQNILNQMDRIMIGKLLSSEDVALYSYGYNIGLIISLILMNMNTVWCPWYFEEKKRESSTLPQAINYYLGLALFLTLGYLTVAPDLSLLLGGTFYAKSVQFNGIIILSYFFRFLYTFPVNIQFYHTNTKMIPVGTIIAGGINIMLNVILIPWHGIYGAAIATVLSYIALLILHHIISRKLYSYDEVNVKTYLILSVIATGYMVVMNLLSDRLFIRWILGLIVVGVYVLYYKKDINQIASTIKLKKK